MNKIKSCLYWFVGMRVPTEDKTKEIDPLIVEENKIRGLIEGILKKKGTYVSMAPRSNKYFIKNKSIGVTILINGDAELVKMSNHNWKYGWKFREGFIKELIELSIDWIENDRAKLELETFNNEIELIDKIASVIDGLEDA